MVSVDEALKIVFSHLFIPQLVSVPLNDAVGRIIAEEIKADRDFPPFDRVAMDGIAIAEIQFRGGQRSFALEAVQAAGEPRKALTNPGQAVEVMTGAILPLGTDTVIRYEDLSIKDRVASITIENLTKGLNVHHQGQDATKEEVLLGKYTKLSSAEIALLASVGKTSVLVLELPRTAIISSGDELVAVDQTPEVHQIRRSNVFAIQSAMREMQWDGECYHMPDREDVLKRELQTLADENDVLILSGGVSKGKFDFIPEVLESIGIRKKFHQVSQRPGKPFWFGASDSGKVAFALPGNPVSTFMCFFKYIKPWTLKSTSQKIEPQWAVLAEDFSFPPKLTYFLQVATKNEKGRLMAYPLAGGGSGDFANLKDVTGFLELDISRSEFKAGEVFPYIPFRS